jgi:hypothetical protein
MGCGEVFIRKRDLKQHLSKIHGITHPISQIQILNSWGYEIDKDRKVSFKITLE